MTSSTPKDHHWSGLSPRPDQYFGFVYVITDHTTGRLYIGKKQYWMSKRIKGCKTKISDRQSPKWKHCCWRVSDWKLYKGSSKSLAQWMEEHPDNHYEYSIIRQCRSKGTLHFAEVEALVRSGSLWIREEDGEHVFFNRQIPATRFRPPSFYGSEPWDVELDNLGR